MSSHEFKLGYRPGLDGLRGIAIALVLARHLGPSTSRFPGYVGVDVFFVLSGFLITSLLMQEWRTCGNIALGTFYRRRLARLYPALTGMLLLFMPLAVAIVGIGTYLAMAGVAATYTTNLLISAKHVIPGPMLHTWSLAQEEQFYLLWPVLLLGALRRRVHARALASALIIAAFGSWMEPLLVHASGIASAFRPDFRVAPMLVGCALAIAPAPSQATRPSRRPYGVAGAALLTAAMALWSVRDVPSPIPGLLVIVTTVATTAMIADVMWRPNSAHARALAVRPIRGLGQISYSLYLWHFPILWVLGTTHLGWATRTAIALVASLATAYASRRWIELPFLRRRDGRSRGPARVAVADGRVGDPTATLGTRRRSGAAFDAT